MICNLGDMNKCRIHAPFAVAFLLSPKSLHPCANEFLSPLIFAL
jgi:hypothetical protein